MLQKLSFALSFGFILGLLIWSCSSPIPTEVQVAYEQLPETVDFNFHIRPILSDRCFSCHGPDENTREAGLRLDQEASAFATLGESGNRALVKGNLARSAVWDRITQKDADMVMPPPESHLSLSQKEIALIGKWIEQGAEWKKHWAFIPPSKPPVPPIPIEIVEGKAYSPQNPIDHFILSKLNEVGLSPAPEASKERLIRRVYQDITGLPPSSQAIAQFCSDTDPQAYERLVDQLLSSDAYAERMAMDWMDVARYADSHGMHADGARFMWPWRDWVIQAFKNNLSYDDFVTWQLAGDLLPHATREQKLASAFQRNQPINSELGIVSEEFRLKYVADRANTTATAFMGLTMECATCHDHKFDPISQKEYYEMTAFFNNLDELGMIGNDRNFGPLLLLPEKDVEHRLQQISSKIEELERKQALYKEEVKAINSFIQVVDSQEYILPEPVGYYPLDGVVEVKTRQGRKEKQIDANSESIVQGAAELVSGKFGNAIRLDDDFDLILLKGLGNFDVHEPFSASMWIKPDGVGRFQTLMGNIGGKNTGWRGWVLYLDTLNRPAFKMVHSLSHNYIDILTEGNIPEGKWTHVAFTYDGTGKAAGIRLFQDGIPLKAEVYKDNLYKNIRPVKGRGYIPDPNRSLRLGKGQSYLYSDTDDGVFDGAYDQIRVFNRYLTPLEVAKEYQQDTDPTGQVSPDKAFILDHYLHRHHNNFQVSQRELRELRKEQISLLDKVPEIMVQEEMAIPRKTHLLERGQYNSLGEEVGPATPASIYPFPSSLPRNRLGLSQWLFDDKHPLTARVAVNRYWQLLFGEGLVDTPHDFGTQGALPSHPELLDWLAVSFRESGWNVKQLLKLMLNSATYRQASESTPEQLAKDIMNRYLSRGPSFRLSGEMIRDHALAVSGLMDSTVGGPSVKPYQPKGLWKEKNEFSDALKTYQPDSGSSLYRRSLYTFIRRTSPPPSMTAFNLPPRDVCVVKRERTNTPLQALILLNDPQFIESARFLAERIQRDHGGEVMDKVDEAFKLICGRKPSSEEKTLLENQYKQALSKYGKDEEAVDNLLQVGEFPSDHKVNRLETAAMTMVINTLMNFDEAYMRR